MSEATVSEEQVLHNELSFEINQELIHLMKRIVEIQRVNKQLKLDYELYKDNCVYRNYEVERKDNTIKQLKEVIEEVRKYIEETPIGSILEVHCGDEEEYTKPLLQILDKVKGE